MVNKKNWNEFRSTGLALIINQFLHIFGWAIVFEIDKDGNVINCYPARVKFRGFDEESVTEAYQKVTDYMAEAAIQLQKEIKD